MQQSRINRFEATAHFAAHPTFHRIGFPTIALAILISSYFYVLPLGRYAVSGIASDFRVYDFAFLGFMLLVGLQYNARAVWSDKKGFYRLVAGLLFLVWASLTLTFALGGADKFLPGVIRAFRFTSYFVASSYVIVLAKSPERYRFLLKVFYANIVIQAFLGFAQGLNLLPNFWPQYWLDAYGGEFPVATLSPHHKQIGIVMLLGIGLTMVFLRTSRTLFSRSIFVVLIGIMLGVTVFAGSRTSWLGIAGLVLAEAYIRRSRGIFLLIGLCAVLFLLFSAVEGPVQSLLRDQFDRVFADKLQYRGLGAIAAPRTIIYFDYIPTTISESPWILITGTGFQNIHSYLEETGAHNNFLQAWLELGIFGFWIFMKLLVRILQNLQRVAKTSTLPPFEREVAKSTFTVFAGVLATMLVGETLWAQYSMFTLTGQIMVFVAIAVAPLYWPAAE